MPYSPFVVDTPQAKVWPDFLRDGVQPACKPDTANAFYPNQGDGRPDEALLLCRHCPVRRPCLNWSLETRQRYGVWGGKTQQERVELLKRVPR